MLAQNESELVASMNSYGTVASPLLDRLPVAGPERLARQPSLKVPDRARFARVAWVRSYVSQKRMPTALDTLMRQLNPELTANWASKRGAKTEDHFLLLDVLRSPALNLRLEARTATSEEEPKPTSSIFTSTAVPIGGAAADLPSRASARRAP